MIINQYQQETADDITALWADPAVKACYDKRELYWLLDAAQYYFSEAQVTQSAATVIVTMCKRFILCIRWTLWCILHSCTDI